MRRTIIISITLLIVAGFINYKKFMHALHEAPAIEQSSSGLQHLALIMDGNRRWAREQNLEPWQGHKAGIKPVKEAIKFCIEQKIPYLSLWALAIQNLKRSPEELHYLFDVIATQVAEHELHELISAGVKVKVIGDRSLFPTHLIPLMDDIERKSAHNTKLTVVLLFCYSGREEIIDTCKRIATAVKNNIFSVDDITSQLFENQLWTHGIPDPDLIIRTGKGNTRLSNFMQYQCAFSELYFINSYWPDITQEHLHQAVQTFMHTKRNFGV